MNKLNDNKTEAKQYGQNSPVNFVLRMYKKYALAAAMEVVVPSKTKRPLASPVPRGLLFWPNCIPSIATTP